MVKGKGKQICMILALVGLLTGCGSQSKVPDDYATNEGYQTEKADAKADTETNTAETTAAAAGIAKEDIKVGVLYISDPAEGSGYSYTHDLARYLSGIVAGMNTKSNLIGYVAAQDSSNSEVTGGIDAFAIGVASVNPDAKINVIITNSWYDPEKEEAASRQLLDMGCDVMAQHCDTAYPQTLAQERGVYGIGYNSDMSKETPDSCLTSVIWNWSAYYTSAVKSIIDGSWDGSNYYGGMAEGLVGITNLASFAAEGTQEKVDEATAAILSGQSNVFDGVMTTNTGETIGQEGSTLDDATITGGINWYYHNVVIVE